MIPLYFIPGTMCNQALWSQVALHLQQADEAFQLNYLPIPNDMSFEQLADYYVDVLPASGINLVGFSLGGYIASYFSSRYPDRLTRLLVVANSPTQLPQAEIKQRLGTLALVEKYGYKGMNKDRILPLLDRTSRDNNEIVSAILAMDKALGRATFESQYRFTTERQDLSSNLASAPFEANFFASESDPLVDQRWLQTMAEQYAHISLGTTSGSGHYLPLEKPAELAQVIIKCFRTTRSN